MIEQLTNSLTGDLANLAKSPVELKDGSRDARHLSESEERFRTLAETIPQIVFTTDSEGHINYMNGKWSEFTGQNLLQVPTPEEILALIHPEEVPRMIDAWSRCRETSAPFNLECRLKSKSGDYRWFLTRAMPLFDGDGHSTRWFGSCTDIDEQRRLADEQRAARERAECASKMKSQFLANMSHEIRTPLGAILGFTELLGDKNLSEDERAEFLGVIARNGASLSRIVDDVLDLSKVEAGLLNFEKTAFCPRTLVRDVATLFSEKAKSKGLRLDIEIAEDFPESLVSDPARIRQIISNLVSNAVKFTEQGHVRIKAEINGANACFSVEDSGIGIGHEHLKNLFQPFAQGDESLNRNRTGTGLGLYLSRKLAEALGGSLEISCTQERRGTVIILSLPSDLGSVKGASDWRHETTAFNSDLQALKGIQILVVDDAPDNRLLIERMLSKSGAEVEFAENGRAGVDQVQKRPYDLVLMDLQMPDMDGFQAVTEIRRHHFKVPIVALTAHAIDQIRERCEAAGFNGFLTKPIDSKSLMATVQELVEQIPINAKSKHPDLFRQI